MRKSCSVRLVKASTTCADPDLTAERLATARRQVRLHGTPETRDCLDWTCAAYPFTYPRPSTIFPSRTRMMLTPRTRSVSFSLQRRIPRSATACSKSDIWTIRRELPSWSKKRWRCCWSGAKLNTALKRVGEISRRRRAFHNAGAAGLRGFRDGALRATEAQDGAPRRTAQSMEMPSGRRC